MEGVIKHTRTVAHANAKPILSFLASPSFPPPSPLLSFPFILLVLRCRLWVGVRTFTSRP